MLNKGRWIKKEDVFLYNNYHGPRSIQKLAKMMKRSESATYRRCVTLGLTRRKFKWKRWTDEEEDYLRRHFKGKASIKQLAHYLNRSERAVYNRCLQIKLTSSGKKSNWRKWTEDDKRFLKKNFLTLTYKEIGEQLGRTENAINGMAKRMGLRKKVKAKK